MAQGKSVSLERLEQILPAAYDKYQLLVPALELMVQYRIDTLSQLNYVADQLDKRHHMGNVAKLVGSAAGVTGSAVAATGLVLSFTLGAGLALVAGGVTLAGLGSSTAFGAHVTEKVYEKVDLEKVQQAVDRDKAQCKMVKKLWTEFDSYCVDVINTIALADPREESDVASLQTWVQVALEEVTSPVMLIAETFHKVFDGILADKEGQELCAFLGKTAREMIGNPVTALKSIVSKVCQNLCTGAGTIAFLILSAIAIGNLFVLITTLIDMHKGSPSKVAEELRKNFKKLQEELDKWLDVFGNTRDWKFNTLQAN